MVVAKLKDINYKYPLAEGYALKDVNFEFEAGKFYGLIGENGGGKTTLCNLIRGLIPHFYNGELTGEAVVFDTDIKEHNAEELAVRIGYVFQNPFNQMSGIKSTVFEEIAMGLENLGIEKEEIIERVSGVCELLGIEELMTKNPNELSGGQRQRVAFAAIIVMDNDMLVIDEPTSQLDPHGTEMVFEIIRKLKDSGKTIVLVEHKIDLIAEYCDEVLVMDKGHIVCSGKTQDILSRKELLDYDAQIPQVAIWGHEMAEAGKPLSYIPITVEQAVELARERGVR
ncbi:energy-coupling factor ABC transporter ATP-binding protein [Mediterraneibacter agrestimuris]|uniref:energy-coupling factor ABC transporter ATP-binding protein n=1 Tax=Mediterraneibacter agrestimuris TaxID=2941333 RepID=UPI00203ABAA9|nr:ABC transporter ATP-binding protein [Mediterraneibacter agrestimuris]